ncbi:MAG: Fic family protein, partial [Myxococcales bacterium]|nr:Fic family protein [Polyangiaceae bacterium]MDW8252031.1 Fic family protein [Myxococcales bacterium]
AKKPGAKLTQPSSKGGKTSKVSPASSRTGKVNHKKPQPDTKASKPVRKKSEARPSGPTPVSPLPSKPDLKAKMPPKVKAKPDVNKPAAHEKPEAKSQKAKPEVKASKKEKTPADRPSRTLPPRVPTSKLPLRAVPPPKPYTLEERAKRVEERLAKAPEEFRKAYQDLFNMSWVFHDAALEGVVYTPQELRAALDPSSQVVVDSSLQPVCDEIRRYREAILYCQELATKKRQPITTDTIKKIYLILHPEEGDLKTVKYRKEIPQHRLYFHEYAAPDKIGSKVRQVVDWVNDPETRKGRNAIRIAGRAHYDLLRTFPFPTDSGRVARLFMNTLLMRAGYPPAIIHSTDRQRYYEALKGSATVINNMVQEAIENALTSIEKMLDEHETRTRSFV